ncbi:hypothetical protein B0A52_05191 [Exophiala mesophila]|uniref:FHA domain-containing protein n=1 Tax=Exophiala mesophila TaxID=212818 RepID=A0A438N462_EXOME|nr:hypothetical protein B0A52_05191 [Exophiala mesophila]
MTTAVASPPNFQNISRLNWNGVNSNGGGFSAMSSDEVPRIFPPQRKTVQRSTSSSSLSSNSSSTSTVTITQSEPSTDVAPGAKKKARGGLWPVSKSESTASVSNARANGSLQTAISNSLINHKSPVQPALPNQAPINQVNGSRTANVPAPGEPAAVLALLPMNGTFERKQISLPFFPDVLRVGRQTNAKTVPTPINGYFDSKVLSRQHAEVWAERNGKVYIRDVKSSNGTFVNGQRLSPENRESEPHELRQHDTLELGIDIVSEDQKTIVHHKVSAKVEYVGLPGASNNVLDLSFGDLDPSHGGSLLPSPVSSPMMHSRSRSGGPSINGRSPNGSSVAGSQMSSAAQQRQANFYGSPLNVEQLVKSLAVEMRTAKQQAEELEQAGIFLHAMLHPNDEMPKAQQPVKEPSHARPSNGRSRGLKMDHMNRFSEPPAPPPQHPLPEKPDGTKSSPVSSPFSNLLKRSETAKSPKPPSHSPTNTQSSQMLSLIEALSVAKKELDSQSARVKQLEDMLKDEKTAREQAEDRARKLEQHAASRPVPVVLEADESSSSTAVLESSPTISAEAPAQAIEGASSERQLKEKLDNVMAEMHKLKMDVEHFQRRAKTAEDDASQARASLAEMIKQIREENEKDKSQGTETELEATDDAGEVSRRPNASEGPVESKGLSQWPSQANGHARGPRLPEHLEQAVATVLKERQGNGDSLGQSAPYMSMLGVVLIGVGLMAYLNSWQKTDK